MLLFFVKIFNTFLNSNYKSNPGKKSFIIDGNNERRTLEWVSFSILHDIKHYGPLLPSAIEMCAKNAEQFIACLNVDLFFRLEVGMEWVLYVEEISDFFFYILSEEFLDVALCAYLVRSLGRILNLNDCKFNIPLHEGSERDQSSNLSSYRFTCSRYSSFFQQKTLSKESNVPEHFFQWKTLF